MFSLVLRECTNIAQSGGAISRCRVVIEMTETTTKDKILNYTSFFVMVISSSTACDSADDKPTLNPLIVLNSNDMLNEDLNSEDILLDKPLNEPIDEPLDEPIRTY